MKAIHAEVRKNILRQIPNDRLFYSSITVIMMAALYEYSCVILIHREEFTVAEDEVLAGSAISDLSHIY